MNIIFGEDPRGVVEVGVGREMQSHGGSRAQEDTKLV